MLWRCFVFLDPLLATLSHLLATAFSAMLWASLQAPIPDPCASIGLFGRSRFPTSPAAFCAHGDNQATDPTLCCLRLSTRAKQSVAACR